MQYLAENSEGSKAAYPEKIAAPPISRLPCPKSVSTHSVGCVTIVQDCGASGRLSNMLPATENLAGLALRRILQSGHGLAACGRLQSAP